MRLRERNRQLCAKNAAAPLTARICPDALKHSSSLPHIQVCETEREEEGGRKRHREKHVQERGVAASGHGRNGPQLSSPRPLTLSPLEPAHGLQLNPPAVLPRSACLQQSASTDTGADSRGEKLKPAAWLSLLCGLVQTHIAKRTANISKTCQRSCWLGLDAGASWLQCVDTSHQGPTPSPTTGLFKKKRKMIAGNWTFN